MEKKKGACAERKSCDWKFASCTPPSDGRSKKGAPVVSRFATRFFFSDADACER